MKLLIVGGGQFVGRHIVEAAVADGHDVYLANRGETSTDLFGAAGHFKIDRGAKANYASLEGQTFDAVLDVSAYFPRAVRELHKALGRPAGTRYLFISTVSVYDPREIGDSRDESCPLLPPIDRTEEVDGRTYGGLKVACERDAEKAWGEQLSVVRPGIIAGPHDHTQRYTWWTRELAEGASVKIPDRRDQPVQAIDARDLATFCLAVVKQPSTSPADATGEEMTIEQLARETAEGVGNGDVTIDWTAIEEKTELPPLTMPADSERVSLFQRQSSHATSLGLSRRPLRETATATRESDLA